jgi:acetyl esterase/lipase
MSTRLVPLLAGLAAASTLALSASLRFPEVLLDAPPVGAALTRDHPVLAVAGLLGLLACGLLVPAVSRGHRRLVRVLGWAGGLCLALGALATLVLLPLWGNEILPAVAFWSVTAAPLVLAAWTVARGRGRVAGVLAAVGLLLVTARSVLWVVNTSRPVVDGFHVAAAILTVLALLGFPAWLCWLILSQVDGRRRLAALGAVVAVLAHAGVTIVATPTPDTDDVPAVPSASGAAFYLLALGLFGTVSPPLDLASLREQRRDERYAKPETPAGATLTRVDANGVAAERICAPDAARDRAVLYLHGGGFVLPVSNGHRGFAATLSRTTGACVLLPHYRTAPEHPFPAPVEDTVHAYRWLRQQGIPASRIVLLGDSCGGTFAFSATLMLRDAGEELPAALVALSGGFDITVTGETHRTKAGADPLLSGDDVAFSARSYLGGRDPRDPLVSPLFADVHGLPPALLLAGTQEVLAGDSVRMADHLRDGGVPVRLEMWPGMPHDFPLIAEEIMEADLALRHVRTFVARHAF